MIDTLQVIADMTHMLSYVVLIRQIIFNKSVHGICLSFRNIVQNAGDVPRGVYLQIWRYHMEQTLNLSDSDEADIHRYHLVYHIPGEVQETILFGTNWCYGRAMISTQIGLITTCTSIQPSLFSPCSYTPTPTTIRSSSSAGVSPYGSKPLPWCLRSSSYTIRKKCTVSLT